MDAEQFEAELEELGGKLKVAVSVDDWNRVFGDVTPKQLYERFERTAGEAPIRMQLNFSDGNGFTRVKIRHDSRIHMGHERENEIRLDIYPNKPPKLDGIFLKEKDQSKNLAKRYLRSSVDLLREIGADSMRLEAIEVGAYSWAKYGFTPETPDDWDALRTRIKLRLNDDGTLIFNHHHYDVSLEKPIIDRILNTDFANLPKAFPQLTELNREIGQHKGRTLTVGKALLMDTKWNAKLPFDERHVSFQRFNSYTDTATRDLQRGAI